MTEEQESGPIRLQKALANAGVASRRACEELIVQGQVKVNGKLVKELGTRVDTSVDKVTVRGVPVQFDTTRIYLALNKPVGTISSMADEEGRPDLNEFVVDYDRVFNIGRLDVETSGLLLLTNDGDLAHRLAHPSFGIEKTYLAKVNGLMGNPEIDTLLEGFELEDGFIQADRARIVDHTKTQTLVEIVLHSGKNRIVRRMFDHIGFPVHELVRKQFGPIFLGGLKPGHTRQLNKLEMGALLKAASGEPVRKPRPAAKSTAKSGAKRAGTNRTTRTTKTAVKPQGKPSGGRAQKRQAR
jgi:23S rRNA pseudouridine2605 synthase